MSDLPHVLSRTIVIRASREIVFRFFTDQALWASWWGAGSTIGSKPGDRVLIRYPGGVEVAGEILEIAPPERLVFTYGFVSGTPIGVGASRATIALEREGDGTRLHFRHEFADADVRDHHIQGWRYQLSVFANIVADSVVGDANALVDAWFGAWADTDAATRLRSIAAIAAPGMRFSDRYSLVEGADELSAQIGAYHQFRPGMRLERRGNARHCQGTVLADWAIVGVDGQESNTGTNVFQVGPARTLESVIGIWNPPAIA